VAIIRKERTTGRRRPEHDGSFIAMTSGLCDFSFIVFNPARAAQRS
jgi:hypothetical protein